MSTLLLTLLVTLTSVVPKEPVLKNYNGLYTAINPLKHPVKLKIYCGPEYEIVELPLPAETVQSVRFQTPRGGSAFCTSEGWSK